MFEIEFWKLLFFIIFYFGIFFTVSWFLVHMFLAKKGFILRDLNGDQYYKNDEAKYAAYVLPIILAFVAITCVSCFGLLS